jgi:FlaA1/EpsC-like NDP-sugar epimerase
MEDTQFNKKRFAIIGAGGLGREIYSWVSQSEEFSNLFECLGFLDDDDTKLSKIDHNCKIVGKINFKEDIHIECLLLGIANTDLKKRIWLEVESLNSKIVGVISKRKIKVDEFFHYDYNLLIVFIDLFFLF